MVDAAWRLLALIDPVFFGFAPTASEQPVSDSYEVDYMGAGLTTTVYRLGDTRRGIDITERVNDPNDGMTPFSVSMIVEGYGLPEGCTLRLEGYFTSPIRRPFDTVYVRAAAPNAAATGLISLLREDLGATVTTLGAAG